MSEKWQFWIDRGGTFTDIIARAPDGRLFSHKLLSEDKARYQDAAVTGMRRLLGLNKDEDFPAHKVDAIRMGTTVATNALLERKGAKCAFITTKGFEDALLIGTQNRPRLFALHIEKPLPLYDRVIGIDERIAADGQVIQALDENAARKDLEALYEDGIESIAIALMHGYRHTQHEKALGRLARDIGFSEISLSHEVAPLIRLIPRAQSCVLNAYLNPPLQRYVAQVEKLTQDAPLFFMQSHGGLAHAHAFIAKDAILSGPAGGVIGAVQTAKAAGFDKAIGFDMGGTSTDVFHYAGQYERSSLNEVAGQRISVPMLDIHTVAAGGGSCLGYDGTRLRVGPHSAGADPGPASYGKGGPLAITDCHVVLGRLSPKYFPHVLGQDGKSPLDKAATCNAMAQLSHDVGKGYSIEELADGYLDIAVEHMARAIKRITIERGLDVEEHALNAFGGAGGQLACRVADALGIRTIIAHPLAGVLSALGIGFSPMAVLRERSINLPLDEPPADIWQDIEAGVTTALQQQTTCEHPTITRTAHLKYQGSDTTLPIPWQDSISQAKAAFSTAHQDRFGFFEPGKPIILDRISVEAATLPQQLPAFDTPTSSRAKSHEAVWMDGKWRQVPVFDRGDMTALTPTKGPAIILDETSTTIVEPGWNALKDAQNVLILTRESDNRPARLSTELDPIRLEIFNHLFMSIAEQMGRVLESTAHSVNIKERLDFSCAVFDANGDLVANAPHMPVHLGSMGESVKALRNSIDHFDKNDAYAMNDPYHGGTHLPDITVVSPVFIGKETDPAFFVASRGHHADVGGLTPGSMPSRSHHIDEEGALFRAVPILKDGRFQEDEVRAILRQGPYPARNPDQNIADLKAQIAANAKGIAELHKMIAHFGREVVDAYMAHIQKAAEEAVRRAITALEDGAYTYPLDIGAEIKVRISVDKQTGHATIDFTGTSTQGAHNFNAPLAITRAAVLYVFRCLVDDEIPLNAGCLKPIQLIVPEATLLNPQPPAAVVAGNVETSQAVTNALFLAMNVMAAGQGTMNNLTFGNDRHQYYETLAGGAGAGPGFPGADAVHTHMTNSRLTDPEVIEDRHPVRIEHFAIRRGSGGTGQHRGGNGLIRAIRFGEGMQASLLSNHRLSGPPGLNGGGAGQAGKGRIIRADGQVEDLTANEDMSLSPGDVLIIKTPGGGGYGTE